MEVTEGWERQRFSTALPIRPVEPVRMIFMVVRLIDLGDAVKIVMCTELMVYFAE
jgi:hypothetical protein